MMLQNLSIPSPQFRYRLKRCFKTYRNSLYRVTDRFMDWTQLFGGEA
jgi:hypothetical protein